MMPYLAMIALPGAFGLTGERGRSRAMFLIVAIFFWVMIGLRFRVGTDWNNYLLIYMGRQGASLAQSLINREPGFALLNWISEQLGGGLVLVNAIAALIFCWGFFYLASKCREPFLAIVVGTPLIAIAFSMNAIRQAIALGIISYLYATWDTHGIARRIGWVFLAAFFHFSAIFVLTFVALSAKTSGWLKFVAAGAIATVIFGVTAFAPSAMESYSQLYVSGEVRAPGALMHIAVLTSGAVVYLLFRKKWNSVYGENLLCFNMAVAAVLALPAVYVSSVGAYRLSIYLWPMAMYVWSGMPGIIDTPFGRAAYRLAVVAVSLTVLLGWATFANNSADWLPYDNWLRGPVGSIWMNGAR